MNSREGFACLDAEKLDEGFALLMKLFVVCVSEQERN